MTQILHRDIDIDHWMVVLVVGTVRIQNIGIKYAKLPGTDTARPSLRQFLLFKCILTRARPGSEGELSILIVELSYPGGGEGRGGCKQRSKNHLISHLVEMSPSAPVLDTKTGQDWGGGN